MTNVPPNLGEIIEDFLFTGSWDADAVNSLDEEALEQLFDQLVARSAVEAAAAAMDEAPRANADAQAAVLSLQSYYLGELARVRAAKPDPSVALSKPATWLAIEPVLRDRDFLIRLAQRRLRGLGSRCAGDLADLLGVPRRALETFLQGAAGEGLAVAENRNSGKPKDDGVEEFSAALSRSVVPEAFKRRWEED